MDDGNRDHGNARVVESRPAPEADPAAETGGAMIPGLIAELARGSTGTRFIYDCLDRLVESASLQDAMVVLDVSPLGRQVFRAGRRPIDSDWSTRVAAAGAVGFHTDPLILDLQPELETAAELCALALRVQLLEYDALHDPLTGLYNRRSFEGHLAHSVGRSLRYGWLFSLVLLDLDGFKRLNDQLGHAAGDAVLQAIGGELRRTLRKGDVAARIGGDEFALVLPDTEAKLVPDLLARLRERIRARAGQPHVGFSVGVAVCPTEAESVEELSQIADARLYAAKAEGRRDE